MMETNRVMQWKSVVTISTISGNLSRSKFSEMIYKGSENSSKIHAHPATQFVKEVITKLIYIYIHTHMCIHNIH